MSERLTEERIDFLERRLCAGKLAGHARELLAARARLAELEAQAGATLALLRRLEWRPCHEGCTERFCPWCRAHEDEGHREGCQVARVVAP